MRCQSHAQYYRHCPKDTALFEMEIKLKEPSATILLSTARSGTNYFLAVYQKCFPEDFVVREIFRPAGDSFQELQELLGINEDEAVRLANEEPSKLWKGVKAATQAENRSAIAKIFYYHQHPSRLIWSQIRDDDLVIHLIRRNPFDAYVSLKIATATNKWLDYGKDSGKSDNFSLRLDRDEVINYIQEQHDSIEEKRLFFRGANYREVFYEDVMGSPDACAAALCEIMGVEPPEKTIKVFIKKQKTKANSEIVLNYDVVNDLDKNYF